MTWLGGGASDSGGGTEMGMLGVTGGVASSSLGLSLIHI